MDLLKRYRWALLLTLLLGLSMILKPDMGFKAASLTGENFLFMLKIIPPIFLILGLLDVWVPKETMIKYMGKGSGLKGSVLAFFLGSAAAGPLYAAFPVAHVLLKKEASLINVFIFIGAWSATKVPPFLFETTSLGLNFAVTRLALILPSIIFIALITFKATKKEEQSIYENAQSF
ncbi:MAG: permease [Bacillota bacterium]